MPAVAGAGLWAIAVGAAVALLLPLWDVECHTDAAGSTICPRGQDRNPVLTGLFDSSWPAIDSPWVLALVLGPLVLGIGLGKLTLVREPWRDSGGASGLVGTLSGMAGIGVGLMVAAVGFTRWWIALSLGGLGVVACLAAGLGIGYFRWDLRHSHAAHLRRVELRERGIRTRAPVTEIEWLNTYTGEELHFNVTARLDVPPRAGRLVTEEIRVAKRDAPVVGGTVIVHSDDEESHPTGITVVMEPDPDSIRDPDAEERYPDFPIG